MNDLCTNTWGWISAGAVFVFDHWSGFAAFILFVLQLIYQVYRIRNAKKELEGD